MAPRFLITRLSAIGDCITAVPVACALRDRFPKAYIAWAIGAAAESLLSGHAAVDRFVPVPRRWLGSPRAHWLLRRRLRHLRFDVAIDPQSLTKSALLGWHSGAARRIGFRAPQGRELSTALNNELIEPVETHVVSRQLELLHPLGIRVDRPRFDLPGDEASDRFFSESISPLVGGRDFAVVNPGAGWPSRLWSPGRFAEVAAELGIRRNIPSLVIWRGERERRWAEQIVAEARGHAVLSPNTNLKQLAALLRRARVYVGSDTGPTHLAAAVDTPCVCLCGPTRGEVSGPYGDRHVIVQAYYQAGTSRQRRSADNDAMLAITVQQVIAACDRVLDDRFAGAA